MRKANLWTWQGNVAWQAGEIFWQPLYLHGGHQLDASGSLDGASLKIEQAIVDLPETGRVQIAALWDVKQGALLGVPLGSGQCRCAAWNSAWRRVFYRFWTGKLELRDFRLSREAGQAD